MPKDITSPFSPGRPVPVEFFVGRLKEIEHLRKKVESARLGRVEVAFLFGERGIGKSSLASFVRHWCEQDAQVLGLHTFLGGVTTLEEMVRRVFNRLLKESVDTPTHEKIRRFLGNHVHQVGLFGISVEFEPPKDDLPRLVQDFAPALRDLLTGIEEHKKAILLVLDDINGLAESEKFANWLKSLVDEISTSRRPLPLCLLIVGLEERRQALIHCQPSLARVFDLVEIRAWSVEETRKFFTDAFAQIGVIVDEEGLSLLAHYAGGLPVLAHEIGEAAFHADKDGRIDKRDAESAVISAAEVVGRKHLEPQVFNSLRSKRYRGILRKISGRPAPVETFTRAEVSDLLKSDETNVFDSFLQRMVKLGVLIRDPEGGPGTYRFSTRLHLVYFWLEAKRSGAGGD